MAFRRRFSGRRRGFRGKAVARKEPVWITTSYFVSVPPNVVQQALFQLIGPEDYTPDYNLEPQRLEKATLYRTVGGFALDPLGPQDPSSIVRTFFKAALFVAGDKQVDDGFANDPLQFNITNPAIFPTWCRDFAPMHVFWSAWSQWSTGPGTLAPDYEFWAPSGETLQRTWDVNVRRKLQGDDALYLLVNFGFLRDDDEEIGGAIDVESRNLIMDQ